MMMKGMNSAELEVVPNGGAELEVVPNDGAAAPEMAPSDEPMLLPPDGRDAPEAIQSDHERFPYLREADEYDGHAGSEPTSTRQGIICGLPRRVSYVLVGVSVVAIIIAVAVGAGVGISLSNSHKSAPVPASVPASAPASLSSSSTRSPISSSFLSGSSVSTSTMSGSLVSPSFTTTPTASLNSSAPVTSGTTGIAANSCNATDTYTPSGSNCSFIQYCGVEWPQGEPGILVNGKANGTVKDIQLQTVYTFQNCIEACFKLNQGAGYTACMGVTYNANLTDDFVANDREGDCWLKDRQGTDMVKGDTTASAVLSLPCDVGSL